MILEIDSTTATTLIKKHLDNKHPYGMVIAKVHDLLSCDWQLRISSIFHEANKSANCLAFVGHSLNIGITFYMSTPLCLGPFLRDDFARVALPRLVALFVWAVAPFHYPKKKKR